MQFSTRPISHSKIHVDYFDKSYLRYHNLINKYKDFLIKFVELYCWSNIFIYNYQYSIQNITKQIIVIENKLWKSNNVCYSTLFIDNIQKWHTDFRKQSKWSNSFILTTSLYKYLVRKI